MQVATIMLALSGDSGNTIQKYNVTPGEVAVLRELHGADSVTDILIMEEEVDRTSRAERQRLLDIYSRVQPNGSRTAPAVDNLFPGVAARVFETFDELELPDEFFKVPPQRAEEPEEAKPEPAPKAAKSAKKGKATKAEPAKPAPEPADDIGEIDDEHSEKAENLFE